MSLVNRDRHIAHLPNLILIIIKVRPLQIAIKKNCREMWQCLEGGNSEVARWL
jgi:hypothetical protein